MTASAPGASIAISASSSAIRSAREVVAAWLVCWTLPTRALGSKRPKVEAALESARSVCSASRRPSEGASAELSTDPASMAATGSTDPMVPGRADLLSPVADACCISAACARTTCSARRTSARRRACAGGTAARRAGALTGVSVALDATVLADALRLRPSRLRPSDATASSSAASSSSRTTCTKSARSPTGIERIIGPSEDERRGWLASKVAIWKASTPKLEGRTLRPAR